MRVLLDVNVLVRANERAVGPARALLLALVERGDTVLLSQEMLAELGEVLHYPRIKALYGLSENQINGFTDFLKEISTFVDLSQPIPVPIRDPKDIGVLRTAILGEADVICTWDRDFYSPETNAFCMAYGIEVMTDGELWGRIRK